MTAWMDGRMDTVVHLVRYLLSAHTSLIFHEFVVNGPKQNIDNDSDNDNRAQPSLTWKVIK